MILILIINNIYFTIAPLFVSVLFIRILQMSCNLNDIYTTNRTYINPNKPKTRQLIHLISIMKIVLLIKKILNRIP
jgi:hypothetical protein